MKRTALMMRDDGMVEVADGDGSGEVQCCGLECEGVVM